MCCLVLFVCGTYIQYIFFYNLLFGLKIIFQSHLWLLCVAVTNLVFLGVMFSILQINTLQFIYLFCFWQTFQLFLGFCCSKHCYYKHACTCFWMSVFKNFSKSGIAGTQDSHIVSLLDNVELFFKAVVSFHACPGCSCHAIFSPTHGIRLFHCQSDGYEVISCSLICTFLILRKLRYLHIQIYYSGFLFCQ